MATTLSPTLEEPMTQYSRRFRIPVVVAGVSTAAIVLATTSWYASAATSSGGRSHQSVTAASTALPSAYVGRFDAGTDKVLSKSSHLIAETPKLHAGNYLVSAATSLAMFGQNGTVCHLATAMGNTSGKGQGEETQTPTGTSAINENLSIVDAFTKVATNDRIELLCRDYAQGSEATTVNSAEINAIPVHSLSTHHS
jgi:hypothetical protein